MIANVDRKTKASRPDQAPGLDRIGDTDSPDSACLHASGHASGDELAEFVRTVTPEILIPIHTGHPEWRE